MDVRTNWPRRAATFAVMLGLVVACTAGTGATPAPTPTAAPTPSATPDDPANMTGSLTVLEWSGYEEELYWADFKAKYPQVDVGFEFGVSDADIYGKMKAGSQADVFHPYTGWLQFYVDEGMVEEIDTSRLANWDAVPESFKAVGRFDGKQYFCLLYTSPSPRD